MDALLRHNQNAGTVHFHLLSDSLPPADLDRFEVVCEFHGSPSAVRFTPYDLEQFYKQHIFSRYISPGRFSRYTFYKLAMPWFIGADRVLFLDADALCVADLTDFYNQDLEGNLIAGCVDVGIGIQQKARIGMTANLPYINAGVILCDMKRIRDEKIFDQWMRLCQSRRLPLNDQDAINMTISPRIKIMPNKFNSSLSTGFDPEPVIRHFASPKAPWVARAPDAEHWYAHEEAYHNEIERPLPPKIPRHIYYGWFGGGKKPQKILDCIKSWRTVMPSVEITELNETNCGIYGNAFVRKAYDAGKWGFVWDYFRILAMHNWGGISLDADVELVAPLDSFLNHRFFSGQEINDKILITATMGSEPGHPLTRAILDYYATATFDAAAVKPNTGFITELFEPLIAEREPGGKIILQHDGHLYPQAWFCNYDHRKRKVLPSANAHAVHWFEGSWKKPVPVGATK